MKVMAIEQKSNLLEDFLRLVCLSGVLHVDKVRIVFALFLIRERRVVADPIVPNLKAMYVLFQIGMDIVEKPGMSYFE